MNITKRGSLKRIPNVVPAGLLLYSTPSLHVCVEERVGVRRSGQLNGELHSVGGGGGPRRPPPPPPHARQEWDEFPELGTP
jgi:hypothetical protein